MRFEDFYSNTQQSKQIKNLQESKVFKKLTPDDAFDKALNLWVTGEQIPKVLEDIIATDPFNASMYAREIVKGRWPQGEETILNSEYKVDYINFLKKIGFEDLEESTTLQNMSPDDAFDKAVDLFNKKEPIPKELEDIIATDAQNALNYADYILKGRFLKGEPAISKNGMMALDYAMEVIGGRFPEGEEAISEDPELHDEYIEFLNSIGYEDLEESTSNNPYKYLSTDQAYDLAISLSSTNKPIPKELEEIIAKDPHNAYFYAKYVVKGRFPQGEPMIMSNLDAKANYIRFLNKIGYEDVEESFKQFFNSNIQESYTPLTSLRAYEWALRLDRHSYKIPKELENEIAKDAKASFKYALHVKRARFEKGEPVIATDPEMSYNYAKHIIKGRFPEGEEVIMRSIQKDAYVDFLREINYSDVEESFVNFFNSTVNESFIPDDPEEAYELAKNYQRSNMQIPEEVEDVIAESPKYSYMYALYVLGDKPFPKGEPSISQSYKYSLDYAKTVLKGRFPLAENLLAKDADFAFLYARDVIKGRFPEGEEAIMSVYDTKENYIKFLKYIGYEDVEESAFTKGTLMDILNVVRGLIHKNLPVPDKMINAIASDAFTSHIYARDVIEKPFPKGEKAIAKDGYWSYFYARDVMHGRFPEGEPAIFRSMFKDDYLDYLREINYQDVEESFEQFFTEAKRKVRPPTEEELTDPYAAAEYAENVLKGRWPEFENRLVNNPNDYDYDEEVGDVIMGYIGEVIQGRWPEIEPFIFSNDYLKREYTDYLKSMNYQDVEESFERFFTEAKRKVRKPNKEERTDPLSAAIYASDVVQGRVPELEPLILTDYAAIAQYIWFAIKGRWKEAEETIANSEPSGTARYAAEILKDRWINIPDIPKEIALQAEENIINDPWIASVYAQEAIKGRWPEAEASILSEPDSKEDYINFLKSINYQDLEESYKLR